MKKSLSFILLLFGSFLLFAQQPTDEELMKKGPFIRFEPTELNLGQIQSNEVTDKTGELEVEVYNDGVEPLIVNHVHGCCGTRINDWTKQPIAPGEKGTIKLWFRISPSPNRISRTLTIRSNAVNGAVKKMAIMGEVVMPQSPNQIDLR